MDDSMIMESSFSATINAPIEDIDIPSWCFTLQDTEYQACSPAHCAAGATATPDGRRMSINVEVIGGTTLVQHYVEEVGEPDLSRRSDLAFALEESDPEVLIPPGVLGTIEKSWPDLTTRFRFTHSRGHVQLSGFVGRTGFRAASGATSAVTIGGVLASTRLSLFDRDTTYLQVVYGPGVGSLPRCRQRRPGCRRPAAHRGRRGPHRRVPALLERPLVIQRRGEPRLGDQRAG